MVKAPITKGKDQEYNPNDGFEEHEIKSTIFSQIIGGALLLALLSFFCMVLYILSVSLY